MIEMLDETGSKRFHPIRSQDPSLAGWFGLGLFFLILGREGCEVSADKCEGSQMLLVLGIFPCVVQSKYWSLWCGICHSL